MEPQVAAILMGVDAALTSGDRRFGTKDEHANHETDPQGLTCLLANAASTWPLPYEPPLFTKRSQRDHAGGGSSL